MCRPAANRGPHVPNEEDLYRVVHPMFLKSDGVSSGAFTSADCFSVDIVSRTASPETSLARVPGSCAVVRFNCGCATVAAQFEIRDEEDPEHPDNPAHAHVYTTESTSQRKARARAFVNQCKPQVVLNTCS